LNHIHAAIAKVKATTTHLEKRIIKNPFLLDTKIIGFNNCESRKIENIPNLLALYVW